MKFTSIAEVLAYAVKSEEESYRFYQAMAQKAPSYNTGRMLLSLAEDEREHRERLAKLAENRQEEATADVEGLTLAEEAGELDPVAAPRDAFALAVKREAAAQALYTGLAALYPPGEVRRTLEQMAAMEKGHRLKVEEILLNMDSGEVW